MISRLLHALTDLASARRGKFVVIGAWILLVLLLTLFAPKLATLYNNNTQSLPAGAPSQSARDLLLRQFPANKGTPAILVFSDPAGLSIQDRFLMHQLNDWLTSGARPRSVSAVVSVYTVPQAAGQLLSADGTTTMMIVSMQGDASGPLVQQDVQTIRDRLRTTLAGSSLQGVLTGPAGVLTDLVTIFRSVDLRLLLTTVSLVFVLLILLYRSPLLALLPLFAVSLALQVANALLAFGAQAHLLSVSQMSANIATVLIFGAGTDYGLFIASRFREELRHTRDKHEAMRQTMRAVGEAITSSAGTVIVALCALLLASLGLYTSLGPALIIAIVVMLLAGLTLVPALIVWLGRAAYWPLIPRYQPDTGSSEAARETRHGFWGRLGQWVNRHRIQAVVGSTLLLGIFALGNIGSQPSLNFLTSFRATTDSTSGYALLQKHFSPGALAPTTILLQFHGAQANAYQHLVQLDEITAELQHVAGVASVDGPTRPVGAPPAEDVATLQAQIAALPPALRAAIRSGQPLPSCQTSNCAISSQEAVTIGTYAASLQYISQDATTVSLTVDLADDPYSLQAIDRLQPLQNTLNGALAAHGLGPQSATSVQTFLAGQTAQLADTLQYNQRDTLLLVPIVLALVFLVLALLLRSLVAPLYLLAVVALNFLAAIGVCGFVFQRIQGQDGFNYAIPLYTFIFLVALGADYTIFLMSRVREEAQRHDLATGVPDAISHTGGVITSAGLILAGTFLVLTSLPLTLLYQLGVCVAVGILLDTFVVRGLLVPGLVLLLGRWNWWPGRLAKTQVMVQPVSPPEATPIASVSERSESPNA